MEILANLDDINRYLDQAVAPATDENTALLQIGVARILRGNLYQVLDNVIIQGWRSPESTPDSVREIAGMLIAAQHYYVEWSKTNNIIDDDSYPQRLYDRAMLELNKIIDGTVVIPGIDVVPSDSLTADDFFPNDATDRAFTLGMNL